MQYKLFNLWSLTTVDLQRTKNTRKNTHHRSNLPLTERFGKICLTTEKETSKTRAAEFQKSAETGSAACNFQ